MHQWFIDWARLAGQGTPQLCLLSTEMTTECPHAWFLQGCWLLNSSPHVYLSLDLTSQRFRHLHLAHWRPGFLYMNFWGLIQATFNPEQRVYNGVVTLSGKVLELGDGSGLKNTYCYCRGSFLVTRALRDPVLSSSLHIARRLMHKPTQRTMHPVIKNKKKIEIVLKEEKIPFLSMRFQSFLLSGQI